MKKLVLSLCAAAVVASFSTSLFAAEPGKKKVDDETRFKRMDKDSDSHLSLEEFVGKRTDDKAEMAKKQFARLDKDKDGKLTLEEFKARGKKKDNK